MGVLADIHFRLCGFGCGLTDSDPIVKRIGLTAIAKNETARRSEQQGEAGKIAPAAYLEKERFETEYGVSGMGKERKAAIQGSTHKKSYRMHLFVYCCLDPSFCQSDHSRG